MCYHLLSLCSGHISVILTSVFKLFHGFKTFFLKKISMQQQKSNEPNDLKFDHRILTYLVTFKVINVLFPSISRAHESKRRVHQGLPSSLSLRLSKTPEEAALVTLVMVSTMSVDVTRGGIAHQPVADHLGKHHADWLAQHHSFCFDTTHTCMQ